jgi:hypothetical protein
MVCGRTEGAPPATTSMWRARSCLRPSHSRPERANLAQRHLRISEFAAEALWRSSAATLERLGPTGGPWSTRFQAKLRRDLVFSTMLCTRAVDRLAAALGAHRMMEDTPAQRAFRDVHAVAIHAPITGTCKQFPTHVTYWDCPQSRGAEQVASAQ